MPNASTRRSTAGRPQRTLVVGILIVAGALYGYARLYMEWQKADVSGHWPQTSAKIESSSLSVQQRVGAGSHRTYTVNVSYAYTVGGLPYQGSAIHFGGFPSYDSEDEAHAVQRRYATGATVPVAYDPKHPSVAVLEPGTGSAVGSLGLGALLLGLLLALGAITVYQSLGRLRAGRG